MSTWKPPYKAEGLQVPRQPVSWLERLWPLITTAPKRAPASCQEGQARSWKGIAHNLVGERFLSQESTRGLHVCFLGHRGLILFSYERQQEW